MGTVDLRATEMRLREDAGLVEVREQRGQVLVLLLLVHRQHHRLRYHPVVVGHVQLAHAARRLGSSQNGGESIRICIKYNGKINTGESIICIKIQWAVFNQYSRTNSK